MNKTLAYVKRHFETFLYVPGRRTMLSAEQRAKRFFRGRWAAVMLCVMAFLAAQPARSGSNLPVPDGWTKSWDDDATSINLSHETRDWSDFSIGEGFTVNFTGSGTAINKVTGNVRSDILGTLTGDKVYILNPNGILFGSGAHINVNGLVAAAMSEFDFGNSLNASDVKASVTANGAKGKDFTVLIGTSVSGAASGSTVIVLVAAS